VNLDSIFCTALEIDSVEARTDYLDRACGNDARMRRRVEQLLEAHVKASGFLQLSDSDSHTVDGRQAQAEEAGTRIGPYKLLQPIGEGGMAVVWMAEQEEPVRRKVALKIIKPGMDSQQVIARFEAERQALALMDHLNIARVLDAGTVGRAFQPEAAAPTRAEKPGLHQGRPFFVMELIHGVPITTFCDDNQLTPRERLELFVPVCQAIQHAHQNGVIHRDVKPSNVLVTLYDGRPVPKVIDFGVAKAVEQRLTERTLFTQYGTIVGTFEYMSPEQAEMSALGVDTRSDIYSLGVLLYELLTGTTPLERQRLRDAAYLEILRLIREQEPPRPSTRLADSDTLVAVAAARKMEPVKLAKLVRGELDWIVMKALEKDRTRRYETANDLAADVLHYLNNEPVQACPPSRWYRLRKMAQRHKGAFVAASALVVGTLLAVIGLAASNVLIFQEQTRTEQEKVRAEIAQELAEQRAEEIHDGLERLKKANILLDRGRYYANEMRWDDAHTALTKAVRLRPDHTSAWVELADLHTRLGLWEMAADDFAEELKLRQPDATSRWYMHALLRLATGDTDGYCQVSSRMRAYFRGTSNPTFLIELVRTSVLRPDTDADMEQWVELAQHAAARRPRGDWWSLYVLGLAHYRAGQHEQAVRRLQESLAADEQEWSVRTLSYPVLAMAHHRLGRPVEARQALKAAGRVLDHWTKEMVQRPSNQHWVHHLGATAHWAVPWWDWLEGSLYYREAKLLIDGSPPPDDPRIHILRGRAFAGLRWHDKADVEFAAALQRLPHDSQIRLESHRNRGYGYIIRGKWKQAADEFGQAYDLLPEEVNLGLFRAVAELKAGELAEYRKTCASLVQRFGKTEDPMIARKVLLACVLRQDALPDMARLLPLARVASPPDDSAPTEAGAALYRAGKYIEAVRCFETTTKAFRLRAGSWCFLAMAHHRLGHVSEAQHALAEAVRWIEEADHQESDDPGSIRPSWGSCLDRPEFELLLNEAERLLQQESATSS
jgi:serine/threonine protein kinase/Flp pilus assembly protein TadD